ncbi:MAG: hypothetical protein ACKOFP_03210 [Actinomycetota bacterium]
MKRLMGIVVSVGVAGALLAPSTAAVADDSKSIGVNPGRVN